MEIQSSPQLLDQQLQKMTGDLPISH